MINENLYSLRFAVTTQRLMRHASSSRDGLESFAGERGFRSRELVAQSGVMPCDTRAAHFAAPDRQTPSRLSCLQVFLVEL
jgi:hypothetical protein